MVYSWHAGRLQRLIDVEATRHAQCQLVVWRAFVRYICWARCTGPVAPGELRSPGCGGGSGRGALLGPQLCLGVRGPMLSVSRLALISGWGAVPGRESDGARGRDLRPGRAAVEGGGELARGWVDHCEPVAWGKGPYLLEIGGTMAEPGCEYLSGWCGLVVPLRDPAGGCAVADLFDSHHWAQ